MNKAWEKCKTEMLHTNYFLVQKFIKKTLRDLEVDGTMTE